MDEPDGPFYRLGSVCSSAVDSRFCKARETSSNRWARTAGLNRRQIGPRGHGSSATDIQNHILCLVGAYDVLGFLSVPQVGETWIGE